MSAGSVSFESLPEKMRKKLPRYPVPVARLGRLAVDRSQRGKGLGAALLRHALFRAASVAQSEMGLIAVVVDAKNDAAVQFYQHYGFVRFQDNPDSLFISVKTILQAIR